MQRFLYGHCSCGGNMLEDLESSQESNETSAEDSSVLVLEDFAITEKDFIETIDIDETLWNESSQNLRVSVCKSKPMSEALVFQSSFERHLYKVLLDNGGATEKKKDNKVKQPRIIGCKILVNPKTDGTTGKAQKVDGPRETLNVRQPNRHKMMPKTDIGSQRAGPFDSKVTKNPSNSLSQQNENDPCAADATQVRTKIIRYVKVSAIEEPSDCPSFVEDEKNDSAEHRPAAGAEKKWPMNLAKKTGSDAVDDYSSDDSICEIATVAERRNGSPKSLKAADVREPHRRQDSWKIQMKRAIDKPDIELKRGFPVDPEVKKKLPRSSSRQNENSRDASFSKNVPIKIEIDDDSSDENDSRERENERKREREKAEVTKKRNHSPEARETAVVQKPHEQQKLLKTPKKRADFKQGMEPRSSSRRNENSSDKSCSRKIPINVQIDDDSSREKSARSNVVEKRNGSPENRQIVSVPAKKYRFKTASDNPIPKYSDERKENSEKASKKHAAQSSQDEDVNKSRVSKTMRANANSGEKEKTSTKEKGGNVGNEKEKALQDAREKSKLTVRPAEAARDTSIEEVICISSDSSDASSDHETAEREDVRTNFPPSNNEPASSDLESSPETPRGRERTSGNEANSSNGNSARQPASPDLELSAETPRRRERTSGNEASSSNGNSARQLNGNNKSRGKQTSTKRVAEWRKMLMNGKTRNSRRKYTASERKAMLQYLLRTSTVNKAKGLTTWAKLRRDIRFTHRTPQSLQSHFQTYLLPNILSFDYLTEAEKQLFIKIKPIPRKKKEVKKKCLFGDKKK